MAEVNLTVTADLASLRQQLSKIPGISAEAAERMTAELNKSIRAAEAASKKAAEAAKKAGQQAKAAASEMKKAGDVASEFGDKAGKLGGNASKLAGALDMIGPGAGGAARAVGDLADVGEVAAAGSAALGIGLGTMAAAAGGAALVLAPLAGHMMVLAREEKEAAERTAFLRRHLLDLQDATRSLTDANVQARLATGQITEEEAARIKIQDEATRKIQDFYAAQAEERATAQAVLEETHKQKGAWANLGETVAGLADHYVGYTSQQEEALWVLEQLDKKVAEHEDLVIAERDALLKADKATRDKKASDEEAKKALDAAVEAEREAEKKREEGARNAERRRDENKRKQKEAADAELAKINALIAAEEQRSKIVSASLVTLDAAARKSANARLSAEEKVNAALQQQLADLQDVTNDALDAVVGSTEEAEAERQKIRDAYWLAEKEASASAAAEIEDIEKAKFDAFMERKNAEQEANKQYLKEQQKISVSASSDLLGSLAEAGAMMAESQAKTDKEAALRTFEVTKALGIAEATINAAVAVSEASPNPFAMAAAAVAGGVQIATIASTPAPSFSDTPGVMQMVNRGAVSLASGDFFAAAKDPGELQRQVGAPAGASPAVLEVRLGHRVLDRSVARTVRQGGRLSRELNRMVDRRSRR